MKKKNNKIIIIAEAGINHNGQIRIAKKLVDKASEAGANYIKFQTYNTDDLVLKKTKLTPYQKKNLKNNISQHLMLQKNQLSFKDHEILFKYAKKKKIKFLSTAFDEKSLELLKRFNLDYIKIPSGEITNYLLLRKISRSNKKILLSTGMASIKEIKKALNILNKKKKDLIILHCTSDYPARLKDLNLNFIHKLKKFGFGIGYSDHSTSIITPSIAVGLGCSVVEKHFTLSKKLSGPDHKASLEPHELKEMIINVRNTEKMLGSFDKVITSSEHKTKIQVRKSLVALKNIKKGEIFSKKNITVKRPGTGISATEIFNFFGRKSTKNFNKDEFIK